MRKGCKQTCKPKGLMQILSKGGWQKKVKKATAAMLASAMVLTSGVVLPQNMKTAEAAGEEITFPIGTIDADGNYPMGFMAQTSQTTTSTGDFSKTISFHTSSKMGNVWDNFVLKVQDTVLTTNNTFTMRADNGFLLDNFGGSNDDKTFQETKAGDWASILKDANVSLTVSRTGTSLTVAVSGADAEGNDFAWTETSQKAVSTNPMNIILGGEKCLLTTPKTAHTLTINYKKADGSQAAASVQKKVFEDSNYSVSSPAVSGYASDKPIVSGTMGTQDISVDVTYTESSGNAPQNITLDSTIGTKNTDGSYTLGYDTTTTPKIDTPAGDFSISLSFHVYSQMANNWLNYSAVLEDSGKTVDNRFYVRADRWITNAFGKVNADANEPANEKKPGDPWNDAWVSILKDANVTVTASRTGNTVTIQNSVSDAEGNSFSWSAVSTDASTQAMLFYLIGDSCQITSPKTAHTLTINYKNDDGSEAAPSVTKQVFEGSSYSVESPAVSGFMPDEDTISGTMGNKDVEVDVTYQDATPHKITIKYVTSTGKEVAEKIEETLDGGSAYEYVSPTLSGYFADIPVISGKMGSKDLEFTVTYKSYNSVLNIADNWSDLTTGYKVKQSGDFDIAFSFHNVSTHEDAPDWANYAIAISADTAGDWAHAWTTGGWFIVGNRNSILSFSGSPSIDGDTVPAAALANSDVTVGISRRGSTITITNTVAGSDGKTYTWTATEANCPTETVAVTLTGELCKLYLYSVPESEPDIVPPLDTDTEDVIDTIGTGSFDLKYGEFDKYHHSTAPANDFTVTYKFRNTSAGDTNWNNYAIILQDASSKTWYQRADWWAIGQDNNTAIFGNGVPTYSDITFDVPTFLETIQNSDVTVTVVRSGSTITIYNTINGKNGKTLSWSASSSECPTDEITVMLGGEACMLKLTSEDIKNEAIEPSVEPTTAPSTEPSTEPTTAPSTEPTTEPTTTPSAEPSTEPTVAPSAKPVVKNGDKVTNSGVTYKVVSTKNKTVSYTAIKNSKKTSVTIPNTVAVTSNGKKVTYKVTTIAKNTFKGNKTVKKITIGKNITKIEANAFKNCKNLTTIVIKSDKLTSVAKNALSGTNKKLVIKVPAKKLSAYQKLFSGKGNANIVVKKA